METTGDAIPWQSMYKLMTGAIVPRPIGWVSTVDAEGRPNLAPYSFFNGVCPKPPHVVFCPNVRRADRKPKDTLNNVHATGEFVVNIVTEATAEAMNMTAQDLPDEVDEFALAGLTPVPSVRVKPPRVGESPIHFECVVTQVVDVGDEEGSGSLVIGRVVHLHVDDSVMLGDDKIDIQALAPVGRLAGPSYARMTDTFDLQRPPSQIKPKA